jgi:23S rRNA pseudouridine1911/1915/1917 synthase
MPKRSGITNKHMPKGLRISYEDKDILVVEKPSGLLTMATDVSKTVTVYHALTDYIRKGQAKSKKRVFIVHRLDREASGILIFAKTEAARDYLQKNWSDSKKTYLALVHGNPKEKERTITSYLAENKAFIVYSTSNTKEGKISHTAYRVIGEIEGRSLLEVDLITGRKHQIRVHLAESGHPIIGDRKYGDKKSPQKRLALHAISISFKHPRTGKSCSFKTSTPGFVRRFEDQK